MLLASQFLVLDLNIVIAPVFQHHTRSFKHFDYGSPFIVGQTVYKV